MLTEGSVHDQCDRLSDGLFVRDSDGRHPDREHATTAQSAPTGSTTFRGSEEWLSEPCARSTESLHMSPDRRSHGRAGEPSDRTRA